MRRAVWAVFISTLLASAGYAGDLINQFDFKTVDGKTVRYQAGSGQAMIVNIGSHW